MKRTTAVALAAVGLAGCSTLANTNQQILDGAKPTVVRVDETGEAYIWLKGIVPTVILRATGLDKLAPSAGGAK